MYPLSRVPDGLRPILKLNPMVAPVELTKAGLLGTPQPSATAMVSTVLAIALIGGFGLRFSGVRSRARRTPVKRSDVARMAWLAGSASAQAGAGSIRRRGFAGRIEAEVESLRTHVAEVLTVTDRSWSARFSARSGTSFCTGYRLSAG